MQKVNVQDALDEILKKDPRYDRDAYAFVREALDHTLKLRKKPEREEANRLPRESGDALKRPPTHVTGQELLAGIRDLALKQFGPLAKTVFDHWGVKRCEDFGEIVFSMVEAGLLGKTESDTKTDFAGGYDFDVTFVQPFVPKAKQAPRPTAELAEKDRAKN
jgi:uncharacterized repeat protein (TIGR04138 family)